MSGGGSSGGGGGSGKVDYPEYMKDWHEAGLGTWAGSSVSTLMDDAIGNSPYATAVAFDPGSKIDDMEIAASNAVDNADDLSLTVINEQISKIDAMDTVGEVVDFDSNIYPKFERGMQNINAVQSSAFVQGKSNIASTYAAQLASRKIELRNQAIGTYAQTQSQHAQIYNQAQAQVIEVARMAIVASQEENQKNVEFERKDALWDLEIIKYGANFLASIQGGAVSQETDGPSDTQRALGGAMSGAAMGGMLAGASGGAVAGPVGMAAGAVIGAGMSLL